MSSLTLHSALTLLLIEDCDADSELVQALLQDDLPGTRVTACTTLGGGIELLGRRAFDVVLADLSLADADGLDVVDALLLAAPDSALVVLTGRDDSTTALAALARGSQDYLVKGQHDGARLATALLHAVQRKRAERAAHLHLQLAQGVLDALDAPTCAVGADARIVAVNQAWRAFARAGGGDEPSCCEGADYLAACEQVGEGSPDAAAARDVSGGLRDVLSGRVDRFSAEYPCHSPTEERWFSVRISPAEIDGAGGAVVMHVDVTALRRAQETLSHQALHDGLTGLPNRILLTDRLDQALADSGRRGTGTAVALLDLDHFKRVNDSLGHPAGDELLRQVANRLHGQVRAGDTVARFSGDEFVVVWRDLADTAEAEQLSRRLSDCLEGPFQVGGSSLEVTASIGVAIGYAPQDPEDLLLAADAAMYDAKGRGRGRIRVFTTELRRGVGERLTTEMGLRRALDHDQLVLHCQPVVDLRTGRAVAVEALVRWQHPEHGLLGPDRFIPVAEASGLVVPLGRWVLQQACRDAASWTGALGALDVAVNLSARQLSHSDVLSHVKRALSDSGLHASRLVLEVTESAVMEDADAAGVTMDALSALGVRLAVDDFGTGYSSLLYLRRYPISALKLDRAFVSGIGVNADDDAICSSVVNLAQAVGVVSIGEGVETVEQYAALRALGCHQAQGFLWSPAVPAAQLAEVVASVGRVPVPLPARRAPLPDQRLEPSVSLRMAALLDAGASLHTIAAALNRESAPNPAGVRWHAHAVARHIAAAGSGHSSGAAPTHDGA